jgi:CRP/FNR family cyclic AMP-dependent transcriptional regulator
MLLTISGVTQQIATRLRKTTRNAGELALLDITGRVANTLNELSGHADANGHPDDMQIKITRQELAKLSSVRERWPDGF